MDDVNYPSAKASELLASTVILAFTYLDMLLVVVFPSSSLRTAFRIAGCNTNTSIRTNSILSLLKLWGKSVYLLSEDRSFTASPIPLTTSIIIENVNEKNVEAFCKLCIPFEKINTPEFLKGIECKKEWGFDILHTFGSFAKIAYVENKIVGQIQYMPIPEKRIVYIFCIYVPDGIHWKKGVGTMLLSELVKDMKLKSVIGVVTKTFPAEKEGQISARSFFKRKGFMQMGEDPDFLYYPLEHGIDPNFFNEIKIKALLSKILFNFPFGNEKFNYVPQPEDSEKVLIMYGPSFCPYTFPFFKRSEEMIKEIDSNIPIIWLNRAENPEEFEKRNVKEGIIVNGKYVQSTLLEKDKFQKEVKEALRS